MYKHILTSGDKMPDGTVFAGISPDTGKPMYATPEDSSLTMTFNCAKEYTQALNTQKAHGRDDWRLPTKNELTVLFNNRTAIGGFAAGASGVKSHYRSSSPNLILDFSSWGMPLSHRNPEWEFSIQQAAVRAIRCTS